MGLKKYCVRLKVVPLQNEPRGRPTFIDLNIEEFLRAKPYENEDSMKNAISEFIDSSEQSLLKTGIYTLNSR